jgi:hypothetical protein
MDVRGALLGERGGPDAEAGEEAGVDVGPGSEADVIDPSHAEPPHEEAHGEAGMEADGDMGSEAGPHDGVDDGPEDSIGVAYAAGSDSGDGIGIAGDIGTFVGVGS